MTFHHFQSFQSFFITFEHCSAFVIAFVIFQDFESVGKSTCWLDEAPARVQAKSGTDHDVFNVARGICHVLCQGLESGSWIRAFSSWLVNRM